MATWVGLRQILLTQLNSSLRQFHTCAETRPHWTDWPIACWVMGSRRNQHCNFFENRPKGFGAGRPRNMAFPRVSVWLLCVEGEIPYSSQATLNSNAVKVLINFITSERKIVSYLGHVNETWPQFLSFSATVRFLISAILSALLVIRRRTKMHESDWSKSFHVTCNKIQR